MTRAFLPEAVDLSARFPPLPIPISAAAADAAAWAVTYLVRSYQPPETGETVTRASTKGGGKEGSVAMRGCPAMPQHFRAAVDALQTLALPARPVNQPADIFCLAPEAVGGSTTGAAAAVSSVPLPAVGPTRGLVRASQRETAWAAGLTLDSLERIRRLLAQADPVILALRTVEGGLPGAGTPGSAGQEIASTEVAIAVGYDDHRQALHLLSFRAADIGQNRFFWLPYALVLESGQDTVAFSSAPSAPTAPDVASVAPTVLLSAPRVSPPKSAAPKSAAPKSAALPSPRCESLSEVAGALTGFVATSDDLARVRHEAAGKGLRADIVLRPWPICEALLTLREMQDGPEAPAIALVGGARALRVGETFALAVTPPRRPSYLYVIYLEDDGSVVNLAPRRGVLRRRTSANAPPLLFGDGKEGRPSFRVTPLRAAELDGRPRTTAERGHEAVIVIAAAAPIAELEAAESEGSPFYRAAPFRQDARAAFPDRLFLSMLRGITLRRVADDAAPREVSAAILPLRIEE